MPIATEADLSRLVELVGVHGARVALRSSKTIDVGQLRVLAQSLALPLGDSAPRAELIGMLLAPFDLRIRRSLDDLKRLSAGDIAKYFRESGCSREELLLFMHQEQIPVRRGTTKSQLILEAANQISGLGLYQRIANGPQVLAEDRTPPKASS